jgi:hypothetical protein
VKVLPSEELLPYGGLLECDVPTLALHGSKESWKHDHPENVWNAMCQHTHSIHRINGDSGGNYHLMDEESTKGMGFCQELPAPR